MKHLVNYFKKITTEKSLKEFVWYFWY